MKKVLWASKKTPLESQIKELKRIHGNDLVIQPLDTVNCGGATIARVFKEENFDDVVVIAPLSISVQLLKFGIKPLHCDMETVPPEQAELRVVNSREREIGRPSYYKFIRFKRLQEMSIKYTELDS